MRKLLLARGSILLFLSIVPVNIQLPQIFSVGRSLKYGELNVVYFSLRTF
jgi:hypothetical protein